MISATSLATVDSDNDRDDHLDVFRTIRTARVGEVFRGVALAPTRDQDGWGNN